MKKWLVGLACVGMMVGMTWADLTSPASLPVEYAGANGWSNATLDAMTGWDATGLGTPYGSPNASAKLDHAGDNVIIYFDAAPGNIVYSLRRSDAAAMTNAFEAKLQEASDTNSWTDVQTYDGSGLTGTLQLFTNALSPASRYVKLTYVTKATGQNLGLGYVNIASGGPAATNVKFTAAAAAVNEDQGTYQVTAYKTVASGDVSGEIALSGTATQGAGEDYTIDATTFEMNGATTSATFTVTINDDAAAEGAETLVMTLANVVGAGTAAPSVFTLTINASDVPTHAITITPPANGTVTTAPADEAEEGATVTITATPAGGYARDTITVTGADSTPITVTGATFVMPAQAVTVAVTFREAAAGGALIISQYYEGTSNDKWIEIYNASSSAIDLAAGGYRLGQFSNTNREAWKTDGVPNLAVVLSNSIAAGGTYLISHTSATNPVYAVAGQKAGLVHNGDDTTVLYTGATYALANVVDVMGMTNTTTAFGQDKSFVRKSAVTMGVTTDFNAADWDEFTLAAVETAGAAVNERIGYHSTGAAVFSVGFDKASGVTFDQGAGGTITATAANGTAPYTYGWSSTLDAAQYTAAEGVFTILATAPVGVYTAQVVATDSAAAAVTNSLSFSVVAAAPKYAITITPPANGTVTTAPETEAEEGATVTITATPADGYAVDAITVTGADSAPITVTGATFVMPAQAVTVAVTFQVFEAPDAFITFEDGTLPTSYAAGSALLEDGKTWSTMRIYKGNAENDKKIGAISARLYPVTGTNAMLQQTEAYAEPITRMSFSVASYGTDNMANVVLTAEVSANGTDWEVVATLTNAAEITATMTEHEVTTIPANAVYARFVVTAQASSGKRVNIDNVGFDFGAATPTLSYTGATTILMGEAFDLTFTLEGGGTASGWEYKVESATREELGTGNANRFQWSPPYAGTYYLTMTALDGESNPLATREVTLTVNSAGHPDIPAITVVPGGGGDFAFEVPTAYALVRVEGATPAQLAANTWTTLTQGVDYTASGTTVRILTTASAGRAVRIWIQ